MITGSGDGRGRRPFRVGLFDVVALAGLAAVVLVVFADEPHVLPRTSEVLNLHPGMLPLYAGYSLARMAVAYVLSLGFSVAAGYGAASSVRGRRVILPALDLLQSVPILGFFPAAVFFFIRLFGGSAFGMEAAAVFLIFTSQAWNLAFAVYESLTTIPDDIVTATRVSGVTDLVRWRRLLLPACVSSLTYNSMLSWAAGWYFLIASEVITVGRRTYTLPGLGSYIGEAIGAGRYALAIAGIGALLVVIVALHLAWWSPLAYWARRFRYETSAGGDAPPTPWALRAMGRAPLLRRAWARVGRVAGSLAQTGAARLAHAAERASHLAGVRVAGWIAVALLAGAALYAARVLVRRPSPDVLQIPLALGLSFARLLVAYVISLAWTVPFASWLSRSRGRAAWVTPVVQVLASLPATAFFPFIVVIVIGLRLDFNVASIILILTGMQWYLLFNLMAAAQSLPEDLRELAAVTGAGSWLYLRRFFFPASLPHLVTGSITAWGGGWNALVISETVSAASRTYSVVGIGSLLDRATYVLGDLQLITLTILAIVITVAGINRLFWRPLYSYVATRYRLES